MKINSYNIFCFGCSWAKTYLSILISKMGFYGSFILILGKCYLFIFLPSYFRVLTFKLMYFIVQF